MKYSLVIIGGGAAGLAAAISASENSVGSILILERGHKLGGILNQCVHSGFGIHYFNEELTGPEYAKRFIDILPERGIDYKVDTTVLEIEKEKKIIAVNKYDGLLEIEAEAVILATGCREKPRGAVTIPGTRPAGVITAGAAQKMININGYHIGEQIVILGSGDIGLIMARRLLLEGKKVIAVVERMPYTNGLPRNVSQCLEDFSIPLLLSHTITEIRGKNRVESVVVSRVDEEYKPVPDSERIFECDTVLTSVGLVPEIELAKGCSISIDPHSNGPVTNDRLQTDIDWIFICGNGLHVHDLVDYVTEEGIKAGLSAAVYIKGDGNGIKEYIDVLTSGSISYVVPQRITVGDGTAELQFRVNRKMENAKITVKYGERTIVETIVNHAVPGQMEKTIIEKSGLDDLKLKLEICAEEVNPIAPNEEV